MAWDQLKKQFQSGLYLADDEASYDVFYGVSDNARRWFDITGRQKP
jgi:hypothetical protein